MFFNIVDYAEGYSLVRPVEGKCGEEALRVFQDDWISIYGAPQGILADNDLAWNSAQFNTLCDMHAIKLRGTIPRRPQSAGIVERDNQTKKEMMKRIWLDHDDVTTMEMALQVSYALNVLPRKEGFSPFTRVFGKLPRQNCVDELTPASASLNAQPLSTMDRLMQLQVVQRMARAIYHSHDFHARISRAMTQRITSPGVLPLPGDWCYWRRSGQRHGQA